MRRDPVTNRVVKIATSSARLSAADEDTVIRAVKEGTPLRTACHLAGVTQSEMELTMRLDPAFARRILIAEAQATQVMVKSIVKAAEGGDWRAAAWYLERTRPNDWAPKAFQVMMQQLLKEIAAIPSDQLMELVSGYSAAAPALPSGAPADDAGADAGQSSAEDNDQWEFSEE